MIALTLLRSSSKPSPLARFPDTISLPREILSARELFPALGADDASDDDCACAACAVIYIDAAAIAARAAASIRFSQPRLRPCLFSLIDDAISFSIGCRVRRC